MKIWGTILIIVGLLGAVVAFAMETTVTSTISNPYGGGMSESSTYNLGLLQRQTLTFAASAVAFLAGAVLLGAGAIQDTMIERSVGIARLLKRLDTGRSDLTAGEPGGVVVDNSAADERSWADDNRAEGQARLFYIVGAIIVGILVIGLVLFNRSSGRTAEDAAIEANADALADNLEMQADNLDALADNVVARP